MVFQDTQAGGLQSRSVGRGIEGWVPRFPTGKWPEGKHREAGGPRFPNGLLWASSRCASVMSVPRASNSLARRMLGPTFWGRRQLLRACRTWSKWLLPLRRHARDGHRPKNQRQGAERSSYDLRRAEIQAGDGNQETLKVWRNAQVVGIVEEHKQFKIGQNWTCLFFFSKLIPSQFVIKFLLFLKFSAS